MKSKLLFTAAFIALTGLVYSQNYEIIWEGEVLEPNAEITVQGSVANFEIVAEVDITYTGATAVDVVCQRYELDMVANTSSAICWGGLCYAPSTSLSPISMTMNPGVLEENVFSGHYYAAGNPGVSTIAYTFYDENNPSDSAMITVIYDGLQVGVNELGRSDVFEVYPNPANDFITLDLTKDEIRGEVTLQLIDVAGTTVKETILSGNTIRISTAEIAEGVYMYRALVNNTLLASGKIVVKH